MVTQFFMAMRPPTCTAQEKQVRVVHGKPQFYEPQALAAARAKLCAHLGQHRPEQPYTGGVRLVVKWLFPRGKHPNGSYRTTKPDTDNLQKLLKDCMTAEHFWTDDALGVLGDHREILGGHARHLDSHRAGGGLIWTLRR